MQFWLITRHIQIIGRIMKDHDLRFPTNYVSLVITVFFLLRSSGNSISLNLPLYLDNFKRTQRDVHWSLNLYILNLHCKSTLSSGSILALLYNQQKILFVNLPSRKRCVQRMKTLISIKWSIRPATLTLQQMI